MTSLLLLVGLAFTRPSPASLTHFQMTVTPIATGYKLECSTGCNWSTLRLVCSSHVDCHKVVDQDSAYASPHSERSSGEGFAFEFAARPGGWELISDRGTTWAELGWQCPHDCPATVDESGVRGNAIP